MIIWGTSSTELKERYGVNLDCNICDHNQFLLYGRQNYGHIWYLPLFPSSKDFFLTCQGCSATVQYSQSQLPNKEDYQFATPKASYLGWIIILFAICAIFITEFLSEKKNIIPIDNKYIIKNKVDQISKYDFLILDSKTQRGYGIAKVLDNNKGELSLKLSKYIYKSKSHALRLVQQESDIFEDSFYVDEYYDYTVKELQDYYNLKEVVIRKDDPERVNN